jgi:hypothetical protein
MARFESEGGAVPMLCPGCCTLDDIPDWEDWDTAHPQVIVGCHRCAFTCQEDRLTEPGQPARASQARVRQLHPAKRTLKDIQA